MRGVFRGFLNRPTPLFPKTQKIFVVSWAGGYVGEGGGCAAVHGAAGIVHISTRQHSPKVQGVGGVGGRGADDQRARSAQGGSASGSEAIRLPHDPESSSGASGGLLWPLLRSASAGAPHTRLPGRRRRSSQPDLRGGLRRAGRTDSSWRSWGTVSREWEIVVQPSQPVTTGDDSQKRENIEKCSTRTIL